MAATTQVKFAAALRASVPLSIAGIRAGCIAPTAQPTGTLIRLLEAVSATRLNESPLHPLCARISTVIFFFFWALAARVWRRSRACTATARVHIQVKSGPVSRSYRARCAPIVRTNRTRTNTQELDGGSKKLKHVPSQ